MSFEVGMLVVVKGRYEDFTDHLEGCTVTVVNGEPDKDGYISVEDDSGDLWYVRATDVRTV